MMKLLMSLILIQVGLNLKSQDTLSINQFDSLVIQNHNKMNMILQLKDSLSVGEAITLIRIENTLSYGVDKYIGKREFNIRKKKYLSFDSCFKIYFIKKVINKIEAKLGYGLGYYSKKYDILLGGNMTDSKSRYYIKKIKKIPKKQRKTF